MAILLVLCSKRSPWLLATRGLQGEAAKVVTRQMNSRLWARRVDCESGAKVFDERRSVSRMSEDTKSRELKSMMAYVLKREVTK